MDVTTSTAMAHFSSLTQEEKNTFLAQLEATRASVTKDPVSPPTVAVPLILAPPDLVPVVLSADMKGSQDTVQHKAGSDETQSSQPGGSPSTMQSVGSQETTTTSLKDAKSECQRLLNNATRGLGRAKESLKASEIVLEKLPTDKKFLKSKQRAQDNIVKYTNTIKDLEKEAAEIKARELEKEALEGALDGAFAEGPLDSGEDEDEDEEEDEEEDSEGRKHGKKRKVDERDEEEDEEQLAGMKRKPYIVEGGAAAGERDSVLDEFDSDSDMDDFGQNQNDPLPEKINYKLTIDPKTGERKFTCSIDGLQQIIGGMEDVRQPVLEAWKLRAMFKAGFEDSLPPDADDWAPGKSIKMKKYTEQTAELYRENKALKKLYKALPNINVSFTGKDAQIIQLAHEVVIQRIPVSKNVTKGPGAPEKVLLYSSKPDVPVSEQEPLQKKDRKATTPQRKAE